MRGGSYFKDACLHAGLGLSSAYRYLAIADAGEPKPDDYPNAAQYRNAREYWLRCSRFRQAVDQAEADAKVESIARIRTAGKQGVWQADAWYLERKYPGEYGRTRVELSGVDGAPLKVTIEHHAQRLGLALDGALDDIGIDGETRERLHAALGKRLRAMTTANAVEAG